MKTWNIVFTESNQYSAFHRGIHLGTKDTRQEAMDLILRSQADERNKARRERHATLTSLGLVRVRGALGGIYYE